MAEHDEIHPRDQRDGRDARGSASPGQRSTKAAGGTPGKRTLTEGLPPGPAGTPASAAPDPAPAATQPPLEKPYYIAVGGMSALVQRDWLREASYAHYLELVRAMHMAGAFPWASAARLERLARSYSPPKPTAPERMELGFGVQALATVGLPPDQPYQIERAGDDLIAILTITGTAIAPAAVAVGHGNTPVMTEVAMPRQVASARPDHVVDLEPIDSAAVYRALADHTGLAVVDPIELSAVVANPTTILLRLADHDLATVFGAGAWQAWKAPAHGKRGPGHRASGPARTSPATTPPAPAPAATAPELTPAERARVTAWLHEAGAGPATALPRELVAMIDGLQADPDLARAVQASLGAQAGPARALDVIALGRVIDRARLERERARLGLGAATLAAPSRDADPLGIDIPARLVQHGLLLAGRPAHFELVLDWSALGGFSAEQREALARRPWHAVVEWVFERSDTQDPALPSGAPITRPELTRTEHTGNEVGVDRTFRLGPHEGRGVWTVHAFLHTSHFAPRHVVTAVEVKTEAARMADLRGEAFAGLAPDHAPAGEPHTFDLGVMHDLASAARIGPRRGDADADGTLTRGSLPAGFAARTAGERATARAAEIAQTEQLRAYLTGQRRSDNADAIDAATRRLAQLREADGELRGDEAHGWQSFELRGTYLSRQPEVPSGALDLYGTVKRARTLGPLALEHVEIQIRDHTQRLGPENFQFTGIGATFAAALEAAFVGLCKQYPEGKLAVMAQELDPGPAGAGRARGTGQAIGFELATTSPWKRLESKIYSPAVQTIVNVAATALMVFQPELAPLLLPLLTASSTVHNLDELIARHANHTLTTSTTAITLAQIGLDFLPYARSARLLHSEARLFAFEVANHAGMVAVMGLRARQDIAQIQEGDIAALAEQYRALLALEQSANPSDATLAQQRAEIAAAAQRIRDATAQVWTRAIGENGIFLIGSHVLTSIQRTRLEVGDGLAGDPASDLPHAPHTPHTPHAPHAGDAVAHAPATALHNDAAPQPAVGAEPAQPVQPAPAATPDPTQPRPAVDARVPEPRGAAIAARVPGATYEGNGRFRVATHGRHADVTIQRVQTGAPRARPGVGADVVLEIPTGLDDAALAHAVAEQLRAVHDRLVREPATGHATAATSPGERAAGQDAPAAAEPSRHPGQSSAAERYGLHDEAGPGSFEVTAAAVHGSTFRGRERAHEDPAAVLATAHGALVDVATGHRFLVERVDVSQFRRSDERTIAEHTYLVHLDAQSCISIRISAGPLEGQTVARTVMNPTKEGLSPVVRDGEPHLEAVRGRYVIQISDRLAPEHVQRAIAHEVAELLARREFALRDQLPGRDTLRPHGALHEPLSPHDRGRLAEINELGRAIARGDEHAAGARRELAALIEELGVRDGVPGAIERRQRIAEELTPEARAALGELARSHEALSPPDAAHLTEVRARAADHQREQAAFDQARRPLFETPTTGTDGPVSHARARELRDAAGAERAHKVAETTARYRALIAAGQRPRCKLQIGGNAALAARDPSALLVDAAGRWHVDASAYMAQTAHQMEPLRDIGFGNPYEFARPGDRVPIEAVQFWQDKIAAQGPVIDGHASLGLDEQGTLLATIHPLDGSPPIVIEVEGTPLVAVGFPTETTPAAARDLTPRKALQRIEAALAALAADPALGPAATRVRAQLGTLGIDGVAAGHALDALGAEPALVVELERRLPKEVATLGAERAWAKLRADDRASGSQHVFLGDEANRITPAAARLMRRVVIAGTGGTGISAAEIILDNSPTTYVVIVGKDPPTGLLENDQFRRIVAAYGSPELARRFHVAHKANPTRFEFRDGYLLGAPEAHDSPAGRTYDARPTVARDAPAGTTPADQLPPDTFTGDVYIAALGRPTDLPAPIAALASEAKRAGGTVTRRLLIDANGHYAGYRVVITRNGKTQKFDVTGASSRYIDRTGLPEGNINTLNLSSDMDAPSEGGNFDGGFTASAVQAARYMRDRRDHHESAQSPQESTP